MRFLLLTFFVLGMIIGGLFVNIVWVREYNKHPYLPRPCLVCISDEQNSMVQCNEMLFNKTIPPSFKNEPITEHL